MLSGLVVVATAGRAVAASPPSAYDVSTLAGSGQNANVDGVGTQASFASMGGMLVVGGVAYQTAQGTIRTVNLSSGAVATLAGSDTARGCVASTTPSDVLMMAPSDVATDGTSLYVTDLSCGVIWKIAMTTGSTAKLATLSYAASLTLGPDGNLYVLSQDSGVVIRVNPTTGAESTRLHFRAL